MRDLVRHLEEMAVRPNAIRIAEHRPVAVSGFHRSIEKLDRSVQTLRICQLRYSRPVAYWPKLTWWQTVGAERIHVTGRNLRLTHRPHRSSHKLREPGRR